VAATLDIIGDRWTLLVIRDLFAGKTRFGELAASPERIATNILAARLDRLRALGVIESTASDRRAGACEYRLTALGRSLMPVLAALRDWGLTHVRGTKALVRARDG
jgi:DNA-binding HxlR family transcriptional regulator